jgi:cation diffusion facilitator family transporter
MTKALERYGSIRTVLVLVLALNLAVAAGKGLVGWRVNSIGMVADAFHSLMDASSNVIGLIGIALAARPRDRTHSYGHAKFETFASIGIVALLLITAYEVGKDVFSRITAVAPPEVRVDRLAFAVMGVTIIVNLAVSRFEHRRGRQLGSTFLVADSRHTLSDVGVSISVVAGLVAVRLGYPEIDALVGGIIAVVIAYAAFKIMREASFILLDRAALDTDEVESVCLSVAAPGVQGCHKIRTRGSESGYWIDLHLVVDPEMSTRESHQVASRVEQLLKQRYGSNTDAVIHIEPGRAGGVGETAPAGKGKKYYNHARGRGNGKGGPD